MEIKKCCLYYWSLTEVFGSILDLCRQILLNYSYCDHPSHSIHLSENIGVALGAEDTKVDKTD